MTDDKIQKDVLLGIKELHENGFAHCDIRIENLFVDDIGVLLVDIDHLTPTGNPPSVMLNKTSQAQYKLLRILTIFSTLNL